jgi:hypothetical protein
MTTGQDAEEFLHAVAPPARQAEARHLNGLFRQVTGFAPQVWAGGILGYGRYDYRYESGHSGTTLATGFAPRKSEIVVYILPGYADLGPLLADLGPHRMGKSCLYLRRLDQVDMEVLGRLVAAGLADLGRRWTVIPT